MYIFKYILKYILAIHPKQFTFFEIFLLVYFLNLLHYNIALYLKYFFE
jgi:hypothetical protein